MPSLASRHRKKWSTDNTNERNKTKPQTVRQDLNVKSSFHGFFISIRKRKDLCLDHHEKEPNESKNTGKMLSLTMLGNALWLHWQDEGKRTKPNLLFDFAFPFLSKGTLREFRFHHWKIKNLEVFFVDLIFSGLLCRKHLTLHCRDKTFGVFAFELK